MIDKLYFVPRRYHIYYKFENEEGILWDRRLTDVLNIIHTSLSLSTAYAYLFTKGIESVEMGQNKINQ